MALRLFVRSFDVVIKSVYLFACEMKSKVFMRIYRRWFSGTREYVKVSTMKAARKAATFTAVPVSTTLQA